MLIAMQAYFMNQLSIFLSLCCGNLKLPQKILGEPNVMKDGILEEVWSYKMFILEQLSSEVYDSYNKGGGRVVLWRWSSFLAF